MGLSSNDLINGCRTTLQSAWDISIPANPSGICILQNLFTFEQILLSAFILKVLRKQDYFFYRISIDSLQMDVKSIGEGRLSPLMAN